MEPSASTSALPSPCARERQSPKKTPRAPRDSAAQVHERSSTPAAGSATRAARAIDHEPALLAGRAAHAIESKFQLRRAQARDSARVWRHGDAVEIDRRRQRPVVLPRRLVGQQPEDGRLPHAANRQPAASFRRCAHEEIQVLAILERNERGAVGGGRCRRPRLAPIGLRQPVAIELLRVAAQAEALSDIFELDGLPGAGSRGARACSCNERAARRPGRRDDRDTVAV